MSIRVKNLRGFDRTLRQVGEPHVLSLDSRAWPGGQRVFSATRKPPVRGDRVSWTLFMVTLTYSAIIQAFLHQPSVYTPLLIGLYALVAALTVHVLLTGNFKISSPLIVFMGLVVLGSQIARYAFSLVFGASLISRDILTLPLLMIALGFSSITSEKRTRILAWVYGAAAALSGWYVVAVFGDNLAYSGQYFFAQKNQIGAVLGAASTLLLYQLVRAVSSSKISGAHAFASGFLLVANIVPLMQLRNRSTILGVILLVSLVCLKTLLSSGSPLPARLSVLGLLAIAGAFWRQLVELVSFAFLANYDTTDVNSLSANRTEVYAQTIDFLRVNLLWGDSLGASGISDPHNFVLYQLLKYGAVLSIGYLAVYFLFGYRLIKTWLTSGIADVPPWAYLLAVSFTTSLFEYAQPFGPGTTQIAAWFFVGYSLRGERHDQGS